MPKTTSGGTRKVSVRRRSASEQLRLALARASKNRAAVDECHEAQRQQDSGDDACDEKLPIELLVSDSVDDHVDRRRIRMPSMPPAASEPGGAHRVAARVQRRQSTVPIVAAVATEEPELLRTARRRRCWLQQAAGQPPEPRRQRRVHPVDDARAQRARRAARQRHAGEQVLVERAPDDGRIESMNGPPNAATPPRCRPPPSRRRSACRRASSPASAGRSGRPEWRASCGLPRGDLNSADGGVAPCAPRRCAKSSSSSLTSSFALFGWKSWLTLSMSPRASSHTARTA